MVMVGFFLAALVGLSLGLIGGGESILTVPILVYVIGINPVLATSYSLFIVGTTSLVGAFNYYTKGFVHFRNAIYFGLSSVTTIFIIRKELVPLIPPVIFANGHFKVTQSMATMVLFALLMLFASLSMIKSNSAQIHTSQEPSKKESAITKLLLIGMLVGTVTGLLGAGGGFLIIPALVLILKMPMKQAIGTSLLIIALNSLIGFVGDIGHFDIDWKFLILITSIAILGILMGGHLAKKIAGQNLKKAFGWFVLLMGISILVKEIIF